VFADSGKSIRLEAKLEAVGARVTVQGEPDGAQLFIDGIDRGHTPQSLELSAIEHRIEVRKEGWVAYTGTVTPAKGFDRTLQYRLVSEDRSLALAQTASTVYTQTGYQLRLVPAGTFSMGSERREQGRRPTKVCAALLSSARSTLVSPKSPTSSSGGSTLTTPRASSIDVRSISTINPLPR